MKKFGFGKKNADDGEDANRSALFSRKKASPAPQPDNPYAKQPVANDPYATPYQQAKSGLNNPGPPGGNNYGQAPSQRPGGYGALPQQQQQQPPSGYGADRYGSGGGYGSNRYDSQPGQNPYAPAPAARGPGGYGGLGGASNNEPDQNRDALFAGAQERQTQHQQNPPGYSQGGDSYGADYGGGYGEQRQLTAEEQEEADYQAILAEKRALQQESVSSVNRSVQMAQQANEIGRATLARLGAQGERLHNTEKNLDLAANQNKVAQDKTAELKTLNRSMFAVHVGNPFTSKQRQQRADDEVMRRHHEERDARESTRKDGFSANQRMEQNFQAIGKAGQRNQTRKKDYGKYNLDDEEGADELEDQIDDGIDQLESQVSMMNMVGRAIGKEVDAQNSQIDRITQKSDAVDDATRMNRARLERIK